MFTITLQTQQALAVRWLQTIMVALLTESLPAVFPLCIYLFVCYSLT